MSEEFVGINMKMKEIKYFIINTEIKLVFYTYIILRDFVISKCT